MKLEWARFGSKNIGKYLVVGFIASASGQTAAVTVPTTPGLEYSAAGVLDYSASGRLHYSAPVNRLHYAAPKED